MGHSGHQCSHALGRPNLHIVSSSRRPRRVRVSNYIIACSLSRVGVSNGLGGGDRVHLEASATSQNAPGDAGQLIGQRNREHVVV